MKLWFVDGLLATFADSILLPEALGVVGAAACVAHGSGPLCNAGISSCAKSGEWTQAVKAPSQRDVRLLGSFLPQKRQLPSGRWLGGWVRFPPVGGWVVGSASL